jgi:hypothetical protein
MPVAHEFQNEAWELLVQIAIFLGVRCETDGRAATAGLDKIANVASAM